jgi:hypothetical protein
MTSFYDEYICFIQEDKSISDLVENGYAEYIDEYQKRIKLTSIGSEHIIKKFETIFQTEFWRTEDKILKVASFLSFSQLFGGINFVEYFRKNIPIEKRLDFIKVLVDRIPKLEEKDNLSFEQPYEKKWRLELYNKCKNIVSGYEIYMSYQGSTLCFETERLLPKELVYVLDAVLLCSREEFQKINDKNASILWPLRSIDRFRHEQLADDIIEETVIIAAGLALEKRGVLLAHLWESGYRILKDIDDLLHFTNKFTSLVFDNLSIEDSLNIISCVCADLVNDSFGIKRPSVTGSKGAKKALFEMLSCTGKNIKLKSISFTTIKACFLCNLKGKVNKEERYAALVLANILDKIESEKAKDIRKFIIGEYPSFWEEESNDNSNLYFSGKLTLSLIDELANAIMLCFEDEVMKTYLNDQKKISSPNSLKKFKENHDYQRYLNEVNRSVVHGILTEKIILLEIRNGNAIDDQFLSGVFNFVIEIIRELPDHYIGDSQKLLVEKLSQYLGQLADQNLNIFKKNYQEIINWIYDSNVLANIIVEIHVEDIREILLNHLRDVLEIERYTLRTSELIDRSCNLYQIEMYKEAIELISEVNSEKLSEEEFRRLKLVLTYSNLQMAFSMKNTEAQVKYLSEALSRLCMYGQNPSKLDDRLLKVQICGWLYDRNGYDLANLINDFNATGAFSGGFRKDEIQNNYNEKVIIYGFSLVRILSSKKLGMEIYSNKMKTLCRHLESSYKPHWQIFLIKAWYHNFIDDIKLEANDLDSLAKCSEIDDKEIEWFPNALKEYYYKHIGELNE